MKIFIAYNADVIYNSKIMADTVKNTFNGKALVIVDVQKLFADPDHGNGTKQTARIAHDIAVLAPVARAAGMKIYAMFFSSDDSAKPVIDFYEYIPGDGDKVYTKRTPGIDDRAKIIRDMQKDGVTDAYVVGFKTHACVVEVAKPLAKKFNVAVVSDLTSVGLTYDPKSAARDAKREMKEAGIRTIHINEMKL